MRVHFSVLIILCMDAREKYPRNSTVFAVIVAHHVYLPGTQRSNNPRSYTLRYWFLHRNLIWITKGMHTCWVYLWITFVTELVRESEFWQVTNSCRFSHKFAGALGVRRRWYSWYRQCFLGSLTKRADYGNKRKSTDPVIRKFSS